MPKLFRNKKQETASEAFAPAGRKISARLLYILAAVAVAVTSLLLEAGKNGIGVYRYHQHREEPSEADLGECIVCGGKSELCTHLPIIRIDTGGKKIPGKTVHDTDGNRIGFETCDSGETEIPVTVEIVSSTREWHHMDSPADVTASAMTHIRGNSSRSFDKPGYLIKLYENGDPEDGLDLPLLGMEASKKWALHGPFLDKTLMRNYMWMNISAQVMGDAPDVRFCELIVDGEYRGLYLLMEMITEGPGRVDLTDYEPGDPVCSYILRIDKYVDPENEIHSFSFYTNRLEDNTGVELLYPTGAYQTEQVKKYVEADFNEIEKMLYSSLIASGSDEYKDYIDVDSFVNYYILNEFLAINDCFSASTYFYRDVRGKLHIGPVWDFNNSLDNFTVPFSEEGFLLNKRCWFSQLLKDEDFVRRVIYRWKELRKGVLSDENLCAYIEETDEWLGSAVERNFSVWGYSFDPTQLDAYQRRRPVRLSLDPLEAAEQLRSVNPSSHEEALKWMSDYMVGRGKWLDGHIEALMQYCQESKNAAQVVY